MNRRRNIMDEVKKIEHCKILNTDTPDNSAS
ncbi:TPA: type III secretion protein, partial [Escherichia coli]|nr:type III secretion protein [Escherichia coli]